MMQTPDALATRRFGRVLTLVALGSCWPLIACVDDFRALFLFQDEWGMVQEIDAMGVWRWSIAVFGENFMPLSKLVWWGTIRLFDGSYFAAVVAVWLNHAVNVFLLGWLVFRRGGSAPAGWLAAVLLGFSATTIETLAWTIQWSNVMALTFFLIALLRLEQVSRTTERVGWHHGVLVVALFASAFSFVRGIFCGLALAALVAVRWKGLDWSGRRRVAVAVLGVLPAAVSIGFMKLAAIASVQQTTAWDAATAGRMLEFAWHSYAVNPAWRWISDAPLSSGGVAAMGLMKTLVFAAGLRFSSVRLRPILVALILFELANDVALGIGRYWTGLSAASSSRYQYVSLVVFAPFIGVLFERMLSRWEARPRLRTALAACVLLFVGGWITRPWPRAMEAWRGWRGADLRAALALPTDRAPQPPPRHEWLTYDELHRLRAKYRLH